MKLVYNNAPSIVNLKTRFGNLEINIIIDQNHKGAVLLINWRVRGLVWIHQLKGKEADPMAQKTNEALSPMKNQILTNKSDNGKEFAGHQSISKILNVDTYFSKPYHSWERGVDENTNRLIWQHFKKQTSIEKQTYKDIKLVQKVLNNRPQKKIEFLIPIQYYLATFTNK